MPHSSWLARGALVLFASVLCLTGLTGVDLIRNEGLRARLAAEALDTNHWLTPTLYGEPHLTKPPGMSIAIGLCSLPVGKVTPLTARLPSIFAGLIVVLLFYRTFARCLGTGAGLVAAAILPCSALWLDRVPSAEIDLVQLAWVTGSLLCLLRAVEVESVAPLTPPERAVIPGAVVDATNQPPFSRDAESSERSAFASGWPRAPLRRLRVAAKRGCAIQHRVERTTRAPLIPQPGEGWLWWLAALACVAGGFFTKWTAPAFFYLTAIPFLASQGRLSLLWRPPHLVAAALTAALALGWLALAAHAASWTVLIDTIRREALLRLSPGHHPRPYPWDELFTFPLSFLTAGGVWSICALTTLAPSFSRLWDERTRRLLFLCHAWLGANLLFWTLAPGHRPRHLLPAQPALAALAALAWIAWLSGRLPWPLLRLASPRSVLVGLLAVWLLVKLIFVASAPARHAARQPRAGGEMLARLVPAGETLYLFRLKDEGLLFYYGRPARRLPSPATLPRRGGWCLLTETEWLNGCGLRSAELLASLRDGQGAGVVLVRMPDPRENDP